MAIFTEREAAYLRDQPLGRLATVQRGGTVQNNPVAFSYNEDLETIDIAGWNMAASQKYRNVAAGSKVAFVVDDIASLDPWTVRCLEIRGDAEALPAQGEQGPIIRVHPRRILSFNVDPDNPAAGTRSVGGGEQAA